MGELSGSEAIGDREEVGMSAAPLLQMVNLFEGEVVLIRYPLLVF